jgi:hypothetical protein
MKEGTAADMLSLIMLGAGFTFRLSSNWIFRLEIHLQVDGELGESLFGMVQLSSVNDGRDCSRYVISNYVDSVG